MGKGQDKYSIVDEWLKKQDDETLGIIDITTLAETRGSVPLIDRVAVQEDIMQRADHYEEILDSLYERATMKFEATGKQAFTSDNENWTSIEKKYSYSIVN